MSLELKLVTSETDKETAVSAFHVASATQIFVATHKDNSDCILWYFDLAASMQPFPFRAHTRVISSLATDDQFLLSGAHDKIVLWDLAQRS
jgi:hypothetical protein